MKRTVAIIFAGVVAVVLFAVLTVLSACYSHFS
jgi:hypothetical protein